MIYNQYTDAEIDSWIQCIAQKIDAGTLYIVPNLTVTMLNESLVDKLCNFIKFRRDLHTIEIHNNFSHNAQDWIGYLYLQLGTVKIIEKSQTRYIRRITLNNLNLNDSALLKIMQIANQANYKYVGLAGNNFTEAGFENLVSTLISEELQTRFWLDEYTILQSTYIRSHNQVSDIYNIAQIFSYLFTQKLPYDLHKTILNKLYFTLKENNWLKYIRKDSRLEVLLPPEQLENTLENALKWINIHCKECMYYISLDEIKKIILADPKCLKNFRNVNEEYIAENKTLIDLNLVKQLKTKKGSHYKFKTLYEKKHLKPLTFASKQNDSLNNYENKTAVILDFNKRKRLK